MLSGFLTRLGLSRGDTGSPECKETLRTDTHIWCLADRTTELLAGDAAGNLHVFVKKADGYANAGKVQGHEGTVYALCTQNQTIFSGGADGRVVMWNPAPSATALTVEPLAVQAAQVTTSGVPVLALSAASSGVLFSGGADGTVRKWNFDLAKGSLASGAMADAQTKTIFALVFVPSACAVAAAGSDAMVRLWHGSTLELIASVSCVDCAPTATPPSFSLFCIAIASAPSMSSATTTSPDSDLRLRGSRGDDNSLPIRLLVGGSDSNVYMLSLEGHPKCATSLGLQVEPLLTQGRLVAHAASISAIVALSLELAVSADLQGRAIVWDLRHGCPLRSWEAHGGGIYSLMIARRCSAGTTHGEGHVDSLLSASSEGTIKAWCLPPSQSEESSPAGGTLGGSTSNASRVGNACGEAPYTQAAAESAPSGWAYAQIGEAWQLGDARGESCVWALLAIDEQMLACGSESGDISVFDIVPDSTAAGTGAAVHTAPQAQLRAMLRGHTDAVHGLAWMSAAHLMASGSADGAVRLWDMAALRCVATLLTHPAKVLACCAASITGDAQSADGDEDALVTADAGAQICVWHIPGAAQRRAGDAYSALNDQPVALALSAHDSEVYALAAHGSIVASAGADQRVRLWSSGSLIPEGALPQTTHQASVFALAMVVPKSSCAGARVLLASADARGEVALSDFIERVTVRRFTNGGSSICALLSTASGHLHAAGGRGQLFFWVDVLDESDGELQAVKPTGPPGHAGVALGLQPTPCNAHTTAHKTGILALTAGRGPRSHHVFSGSISGSVACCIAQPPSYAVAAGPQDPAQVGEQEKQRDAETTLRAHEGCVWSLATSGELLMSGGDDHTIRLWRADVNERETVGGGARLLRTLDCANVARVHASEATADVAAAVAGGGCKVYALLPIQRATVSDGQHALCLLAALGDGAVQVWHPANVGDRGGEWVCAQRCVVHTASVLCMAEGAGLVYCGSADCGISKLDLRDGSDLGVSSVKLVPLKVLDAAHQAEVHALAPHGSRRLISASADATIRVWSLPQLLPLYSLRSAGRVGEPLAHDGAVYALLVVPPLVARSTVTTDQPERLLSASADRLIKAWNLATQDQITTLAGHRSFVCALQRVRGVLFSASCDKTLAAWDLHTYERLHVFTGHRGGLYSLVTHEGRAITGSLDATIRVWPQPSSVTFRELRGRSV
jgi:WD40 repeat protein